MALITLDFETYYDKEFSLRRMTYENYVRDPRFEVIMCSIHIPSEKELYYVRGDEVGKELQRLELGKHLQVAHNNAFDAFILADHYGISAQGYGCTMNMARVVKNGNGSVSLDNLSKENNLKPKGDYVDNMMGIRASDMRESQWDAYGNYCLRDSENCTALYNIYRPYFSAQDMNLISETIRWGAECKFELNEQLLDEYRQELELKRETRLERVAQRYNTDTTKLRSMLRSPKAFAQMLRDLGIEPPTKVNDKGKTTFAFAKDDLNFQELGEHEDERVVELYETKVGTSSSIAETRAATFHAISKRGYMPFPLVPFKAHCVTGDTEVLTKSGWVTLSEWSGGEIAQVTTEGVLIFDHADKYRGESESSEWYILDEERYPVPMTHGHTMPYKPKRTTNELNFKGVAVQDIKSKEYALSRCGMWDNNEGSEILGKLYCAIQADGTEAPKAYRFHFTKERKCVLLKSVLDALEIKYTYTESEDTVHKYFYIPYTEIESGIKSANLFSAAMRYGRKFIEGYITVIAQFDGTTKDNQQIFYTSDKQRAEDVVTICSLVGRKSRMRSNGDGMWAVVISTTARCADIFTDLPKKVTMTETPYCTITKTGFWLARYKGFVFVTGNTGRHGATQKLNTQNLPKRGGDTKLRQSMCAPKDHVVLTCDLSQVEARRIAALAGQSNLIEQFAAGQDVYSIFGTDFYGRTISKATPTERNVSKECVLSLGFSAGANSFRDRMQAAYGINMTLDEAKALVKFYRNRHPQIVKFWEQCANAIKVMHKGGEYKFGQDGELTAVKGEIVLADGWRLRYDDITHDGYDEYGRDMFSYHSHMHRCRKHLYSGLAANNVTQGSAARIFHWQLFQMRRKNRIMSGAVHDEYNAVVHIKDMFDYYDDMTTIMRTSPSWAANTPLDCEFEMGHNYGKLSSLSKFTEQNYDMLRQFHSSDTLDHYIKVGV